jgi:hypothetical protein
MENPVKAIVVLMLLLLQEAFPPETSSAVAASQSPQSPTSPPPIVCSAADGIFAIFQSHPLIGLGDYHGLAQEEDFFTALIRDKRFAENVGNVVVEFGDAAQQNTLDRYLAGEDVPYDQLRRVWSDVVGWTPTVTAMGYINFYAQVRALNLGLPTEHRIHVWLGDPPVDWSQIKTKEDLSPSLNDRNRYPAEIIKTQILAKNKKALVIYGDFHLHGSGSLRDQVDSIRPSAFFVLTPYTGYDEGLCSRCFEQTARNWPQPALATSAGETNLEYALLAQGCNVMSWAAISPANATETEKAKAIADMKERLSGGTADALLYLGPAASLTRSPEFPDLYLDLKFRSEIDRRMFIETGTHLPPATLSPVSPQYFYVYGDVNGGASK